MSTQEPVEWLELKGIKPTANRLLIFKELCRLSRPVSLSDLENELGRMDKSSIFRVLTLFMEHDVVHAFEDGRGVLQYELCIHAGACNHSDEHIHFYCESCRRSFCLDDVEVPAVQLPEGFTSHAVSFVIKGECAVCRKRHKEA